MLEAFQYDGDEKIQEYQWHEQVESHKEYNALYGRPARVGLIAILDIVVILKIVIVALEEDGALSHGVYHD